MSFPKKRKHKVPLKWKKVFIWYKVIIEIAQEVETSSQEVVKRYLPGKRLFPKVRKHNIGRVDVCRKTNFPHKRALKIGL